MTMPTSEDGAVAKTRCLLFHDWEPYTLPQVVPLISEFGSMEIGKAGVQHRTCRRCGKFESRRAW